MDTIDLARLQQLAERGEPLDLLFFWGHRPQRDGSAGKGCLSQWWPAAFTLGGVEYASAEHFMMAEKARLFDDGATCARILEASSPGAAKRLGREVRDFDEARWVAARFDIVVRGSLAKFAQNAELGRFLLNTGERVLVEASPSDRIWGIGLAESDPRARDPRKWRGDNLLGFALMAARAQLRAEERAS